MNWEAAKVILKNGGKIRRPNWLPLSCWVMDKEFGRIVYSDGSPAKVYLQQLEATDWEVFPVKKRSLSDEIHTQIAGRPCLEVVRADKIRESISKLKVRFFEDPEPCCHGIRQNDAFIIIKEVFGDRLC